MAGGLSTYQQLYRAVQLRCPSASTFLARSWIDFAFRTLWDKRQWSWMRRSSQFLANTVYNTGTVDVTHGDPTVTGHGTAWTTDLVNRQFRVGLQTPIYTITEVDDVGQTLTLAQPYGSATTLGINYEIYNAYFTVPTDFEAFVTVIDPLMNWQLLLNVSQENLNAWDAQRASQGTAYCVVEYQYDLFNSPALPQYEIWPHQKSQYVWPFIYVSRPPDLSDPGATLPRFIRGDVLLEMALAQAARWPGPSRDNPNPYFNLPLAMNHDARANRMIMDMEITDDNVYSTDAWYGSVSATGWATFPYLDARFMQNHDL